ncbi:spermatogenesis-associated protein 16 [Pelobates fuscus]|uniref:spermatogenesis-associated protein 16 n=1 Tax=Pelobates fuscus TaxID=191477 RepID=UPI002FE48D92
MSHKTTENITAEQMESKELNNGETPMAKNSSDSLQTFTPKQKSRTTNEICSNKKKKARKDNCAKVESPQRHKPSKCIVDMEVKLVYPDEEEIAYEFLESTMSHSLESMCRSSGKTCSLSALNSSFLLDKWLQTKLKEATACYRQNNYSIAVKHFTEALEMCSNGPVLGTSVDTAAEIIPSVVSFIETKLVACYLQIMQPDLALSHAHRSIALNPSYFRNHIRQASVFRSLGRYSEAARSAMIADYIYWLSGGKEQSISQLIKLYWQAMHEEAMANAEAFTAMYTPVDDVLYKEAIEKAQDAFTEMNPTYTKYIYTDSEVLHLLPQGTDWSSASPPPHYMLSLGFKNKKDGMFLEKQSTKSLLVFIGAIQKLQYASFLSQLQRAKEESQMINQAVAELATIPYLQEISQQHAELLQSLMADAMDCLQGRREKEYTWHEIQKVEMIEDFILQLENRYLKRKKSQAARRQRMKIKKLQSAGLSQSAGTATLSARPSEEDCKDINAVPACDSSENKSLSSN